MTKNRTIAQFRLRLHIPVTLRRSMRDYRLGHSFQSLSRQWHLSKFGSAAFRQRRRSVVIEVRS